MKQLVHKYDLLLMTLLLEYVLYTKTNILYWPQCNMLPL